MRKTRGRSATVDWDSLPLGKVSDVEISRRTGCVRSTVRNARRDRGIPPFAEGPAKKGIDWDAQPLGKVPDSVLARRLKVSTGTVGTTRRNRGIELSPEARTAGLEIRRATGRRNAFRKRGVDLLERLHDHEPDPIDYDTEET